VSSARRGELPGGPAVTWQLALDGGTAYAIQGAKPARVSSDACTASPCQLVTMPAAHPRVTLKPSGEPFT
jgi:hypothetical protein